VHRPLSDEMGWSLPWDSWVSLKPSWIATWAFCCGLVSSGLFHWTRYNGLAIIVGWITIDPCLRAAVQLFDGVSLALRRPRKERSTSSNAYSVQNTQSDKKSRARFEQQPELDPQIRFITTGALAAALAGLPLAAILSRELAYLLVGTLVAILLPRAILRTKREQTAWLLSCQVAAAWLFGHRLFAPWSLPTIVGATLAALGVFGIESETSPARWPRWAFYSGVTAALLLLWQPLVLPLVILAGLTAELVVGRTPLKGIATAAWSLTALLAAAGVSYWR